MKIALLGDILLSGKFCINNNPDIFHYLKEVSDYLQQYDYVVGNLETPFVTNQKPHAPKSAHVKADIENISILKYLNIGIVNLANNHIYDFGKQSFELTKSILVNNDIQYFGIENNQVSIFNKGVKVALHGYCCYSTNPFGLDKGVNKLDIDKVTSQLSKNTKNGFFNIVSIHCGQEHIHTPDIDHVRMARQFSDTCPYVFYGHHPHVIQSIEEYNNSLIAYSLGNFCIDKVYTPKSNHPIFTPSEQNKKSFILELNINKHGISSYNKIPIYMGEESIQIGDKVILDDIDNYSNELQKNQLAYIKDRQKKLQAYINSRKALRDLNWYLKRFNMGSIRQIIATRNNYKLYKKHVLNKIYL